MVPGLADFKGDWRISRVIVPRGAPEARLEGRARFRPEGAGLLYHEEGELILPGQPPIRAERSYLWREGGAGIVVDYADGRPFHEFDPARPRAAHWCDPDDYRVRYDFTRWPLWRAEWEVSGPRKDYVMITDYRRDDAA
ncbi:DUF6314 family protein [Pseudothioclava arenosa]|uniref:Trigger factor n=1 Tax=Pseudothioclava arenosa TaxID=1795308 RepID=A0A2A4CTU5_9RHOB|nr:DUF6314 family protein [Pseudothioclava arenosa]PCD77682.1 trigger factor [Pseudothioclava arenosa]